MKKFKISATVKSHGMRLELTIYHDAVSYEVVANMVVKMFFDLNWEISLLSIKEVPEQSL